MSRRETLRDNTVVVSAWTEAGLPYRVTIVDGTPRLETRLCGVWVMHARNSDVVSLLRVHVELFVKVLRTKVELCRAEERDAKARGHVDDRLRWARARRDVEAQIKDLPAPWSVEWRAQG